MLQDETAWIRGYDQPKEDLGSFDEESENLISRGVHGGVMW